MRAVSAMVHFLHYEDTLKYRIKISAQKEKVYPGNSIKTSVKWGGEMHFCLRLSVVDMSLVDSSCVEV